MSQFDILPLAFYQRPSLEVAKDLLGKFLVRSIKGEEIAVKITELEIYDGFEDMASHASKGKTARTEIMFGEGGYFYIYLIYGMYLMINIVTGKSGYPSAILLRGGEVMGENGKIVPLNGPGKLSKFLKIDKSLNHKEISRGTGLWIEDRNFAVKKFKKTPRIGVDYAGPKWAKKKWRYVVQ